jgi:uncharacterized protein (DUF433 family)
MTPALLDSGVYDATEVGHLLAVRAECIVRWAAPDSQGRPPVVAPSFGRAFSFVDLVSLAVVSELWRRDVPEADMRQGVMFLVDMSKHEKPLAQQDVVGRLATSGRAWLADLAGGWYDVGKGGQGAFESVVRLYLMAVAYDVAGVARLWSPTPLVLIDPTVQAGRPCLAGTRVPTATIADLVQFDSPEAVADDMDLSVEQVQAAVSFEADLSAGRGIAA